MIAEETHIVHCVKVECTAPSKVSAEKIQQLINEFVRESLEKILLEFFQEIQSVSEFHTLTISKLDLSLDLNYKQVLDHGFDSNKLLLQAVGEGIKKQLKDKLEKWKASSPNGSMAKSGEEKADFMDWHNLREEERQVKTILHILKNGSLPWWLSKTEDCAFFDPDYRLEDSKISLGSSSHLGKYLYQINYEAKPFERLVLQLTESQLESIYTQLISNFSHLNYIQRYLPLVKYSFSSALKIKLWQLKWAVLQQKGIEKIHEITHRIIKDSKSLSADIQGSIVQNISLPLDSYNRQFVEENIQFNDILSQLISNDAKINQADPKEQIRDSNVESNLNSEAISSASEDTIREQEDSMAKQQEDKKVLEMDIIEGMQVRNAGLILLNPYLPRLMTLCNLWSPEQGWIQQELAVRTLHFLATGNTQALDYKLGMEKFICSFPAENIISIETSLPLDIQKFCLELLEACISNWEKLGKTSVDTLRSYYLIRSGKLMPEGNHYKLYMDKNSIDILLQYLPYPISVIKLPWKSSLLFVEW